MTLSLAAILGLQTRFLVTVDGVDLGGWGKCSGLKVDFKPEFINEGGNYDYRPILPGQLDYSPITLERAMTAADSAHVQRWLATRVDAWVHAASSAHGALEQGINAISRAVGAGNILSGAGGTAQITLCDAAGDPVITWQLRNVYPSKWFGPELDAKTAGIAMEKLELVHEGFL
jgi:phage tail-like protein